MPADAEDEPGIEIGDGRVLLVHPYNLDDGNDEEDDYVSKLYRAIVHRYNNYERAIEKLRYCAARLGDAGEVVAANCYAHDIKELEEAL